ncbi:hypothetical protein [Profundibacterium mesophilum]|nr:hypothetical protein [Profundibacterium mesophilum]
MIPDGTEVPVLRLGTFGGRRWIETVYGGNQGWIARSYTTTHDQT